MANALAWVSQLSEQSWLTSVLNPPNRNNGPYTVGCRFTVGASNITVTKLCKWVFVGGTHTHPITIWTIPGVVVCTATLDATGLPTGLASVALATPVTLTAGVDYYVAAYEDASGDFWGDQVTVPPNPYTFTTAATFVNSAWQNGNTLPTNNGGGICPYDGASFIYHF